MPHEINLVRYAACPDEPWRNGGGSTRTLWTRGDSGAPMARISVAQIIRDAPFSSFPGIDRTFCVLGPGPVVLWIDGAPSRLERGQCISFPGEATVNAQLPAGPVRAFNVMTKRDMARHEVGKSCTAMPDAMLAVLADDGPNGGKFMSGDLILAPHPPGLIGQFLAIRIEPAAVKDRA